MGFLDKFKGGASKLLNSGKNKDVLEGACATAAMAAARSGGVTDAESKASVEIIMENRVIKAAGWQQHEVARLFEGYVPKAARFSGKVELWKEIQEAVSRDRTGEIGEFLLTLGADICDQDDGIDDSERAFLRELGSKVGINDLAKYGL